MWIIHFTVGFGCCPPRMVWPKLCSLFTRQESAVEESQGQARAQVLFFGSFFFPFVTVKNKHVRLLVIEIHANEC